MSDATRLETRAGAGHAPSRAFEMIATPAVFGLGGWFADSRLGVFPLLTLAAVVVVFGYQVWRFYGDYNAAMDEALRRRRASYGRPTAVVDGAERARRAGLG